MHQLFTRQSLSRHRCQYLFAWWRKSCQSFQICLFASFTSQCCGCVLRAMRSCGHPAFFVLGWLWGISSLPGTSFQVWFCRWSWMCLWKERAWGELSRILLQGSWAANTVPLALPGPPAIPCCLPHSSGHCNHSGLLWVHCWFQQVSEIYFISSKISVNLGYIWSILF